MKPILDDYRTAPIDEKHPGDARPARDVHTLRPDQLEASDVREVLDAGVTRYAIRDAYYVAFLFNVYDRLADTLGWELPAEPFYRKSGQFLLRKGYSV